MANTREDYKNWFITTALSATLIVVGFFGAKLFAASDIRKKDTERKELTGQLEKLTGEVYAYMKQDQLVDLVTLTNVEQLESKIYQIRLDIDNLPVGQEARKERRRLINKIRNLDKSVLNLQREAAISYMTNTHHKRWPTSARHYHTNLKRIEEIRQLGWAYTDPAVRLFNLLNVLLFASMGLGIVGLFVFGVSGLISLVSSME